MRENSRIERLREKLHKKLNDFSRTSPEVYKISKKLDNLINQQYNNELAYPPDSDMKLYYYSSYKHLINITRDTGEFPTVKEWDEYARKNILLNHVSIEYISGMNWNKLRDFIYLEIN